MTTRLLLVEDDPYDIELIQLSCENERFISQIDIAEDGEQALNYLLGNGDKIRPQPLPRMVWLDLNLPRISGIQVLEAIRSHPRTQNLVVVVVTSSEEDRDLITCYNLGVNSYIVKPIGFDDFREVVCQVGKYWMSLNKIPSLRIEDKNYAE